MVKWSLIASVLAVGEAYYSPPHGWAHAARRPLVMSEPSSRMPTGVVDVTEVAAAVREAIAHSATAMDERPTCYVALEPHAAGLTLPCLKLVSSAEGPQEACSVSDLYAYCQSAD